jgi:POT family proton-dependent oligopeptide transporter
MHPAYLVMIIAWVIMALWIGLVILLNRKVHPKALFSLFMVELWERFSYYGMRAILILYMTSEMVKGGFEFSDAKAYGIYAAYGGLVYLTPLIGGMLADKIMGYRKAIVWGALLMAAGQFTIFMNNQTMFFIGLAILVIGNGFFKPNISSLVGSLYPQGDARRDGAFTIFYMGINIGAFLTPLTCGAIGEIEGWQWGFFAAGIGMLLGFLIFKISEIKGWYENKGFAPILENQQKFFGLSPKLIPYLVVLVLIPISWLLINNHGITSYLLFIVAFGVLAYLFISSFKYEKVQRNRIWVIMILLIFTTIFWTFFELAGSALNLFTFRNIDKNFLGFELTTTFFQSVNPLFIVVFAPIFSWLWIKLSQSGREPAAPFKFGAGLILLGLGFLFLNTGSPQAKAGMIPAFYMIMLYLFVTLGELVLSPVGLSLVTKLAPAKVVAFLMGIWFLSSSLAHIAGAPIAKLTAVEENKIVTMETFLNRIDNTLVRDVIAKESFATLLENNSLENAITSEEFLTDLNSRGEGVYQVAKVQIKEYKEKAEKLSNKELKEKELKRSFVSFLTTTPGNSQNDEIMVLDKDAVNQLYDQSISREVVSSLRQESLGLGLRVFSRLGYIAIGFGLLLLILGRGISRWMHGIK